MRLIHPKETCEATVRVKPVASRLNYLSDIDKGNLIIGIDPLNNNAKNSDKHNLIGLHLHNTPRLLFYALYFLMRPNFLILKPFPDLAAALELID